MSRGVILALVVMMAMSVAALAQQPQGPPQPGPEHKRLGYYVGSWKHEAEMKASEMGPGGKYTATENCEWYAGNFSVVCRTEGTISSTAVKALSVLGWDPAEKTYVYFETNNLGEAIFARGIAEGDTWTWTSEHKTGDKVIRVRFTAKQVSPDSTSYKFEMGPPEAMKLLMEGKGTRIK